MSFLRMRALHRPFSFAMHSKTDCVFPPLRFGLYAQTCSAPHTRCVLCPSLHEPTHPADPASQPAVAPQSQALPSMAYRRLPPQVVLPVVVRVRVIVVLLLSENDCTTSACVLLLLVIYMLSGRIILFEISAWRRKWGVSDVQVS